MSRYASGADMWQEYKAQYGDAEARGICNRYLDLQTQTTNPEELQFCRELYAAMQADLPQRTEPNKKTFEYGGYHFTPVRQFRKNEVSKQLEGDSRPGKMDAQYAMRNMHTDRAVDLPGYSYDDFYAASSDKNCDIFRCEETERLYVPGANELFGYKEPKQREAAPRKSVVAKLERAKREQAPPAYGVEKPPGRKGDER